MSLRQKKQVEQQEKEELTKNPQSVGDSKHKYVRSKSLKILVGQQHSTKDLDHLHHFTEPRNEDELDGSRVNRHKKDRKKHRHSPQRPDEAAPSETDGLTTDEQVTSFMQQRENKEVWTQLLCSSKDLTCEQNWNSLGSYTRFDFICGSNYSSASQISQLLLMFKKG